MTDTLISPTAREMIGVRLDETTGVVYKQEFQRWAASVGDHNPLYFDEAFARAHGHRDVIMPPGFIREVVAGVRSLESLRPDGSPANDGLAIPLPERRMVGGEEYFYHVPIYPGDELVARRTIVDISEKHGRSGAFVLVTVETVYVNQDDAVVAESTSAMIAR